MGVELDHAEVRVVLERHLDDGGRRGVVASQERPALGGREHLAELRRRRLQGLARRDVGNLDVARVREHQVGEVGRQMGRRRSR